MDLAAYAERAAELVNTTFETLDDARAWMVDRDWLAVQLTEADLRAVRRLQPQLRSVFAAADAGEEPDVVARLNELLAAHPVTPVIAGDGPGDWHLHVADRRSSVAELVAAESLMGLATLACDLGPARLGVCDGAWCDNVYVDTSPNTSRRYCSDRCSSRANVAAYRARQRNVPEPADAEG